MESEDLLGLGENQAQEKKKPSPLISLEKDLAFYAESIKEIAHEIIAEGLSNTPIFIAHQHQVSIGELILDREELNTSWSIQASTIEEFIEKGIIKPYKKEHFLKNYKNPNEYICVFVVVPEGANYVFYPYPKK